MKVAACGVCRTDLHLAEGDLSPRRHGVVPGHEIVGVVDALGAGTSRFALGDRIGIAWLRGTCGRCRWCRRGRENLCPERGVHRLGRRRRLRRIRRGAGGLRLPPTRRPGRHRRSTAALRGNRRVPGAPTRRAAAGGQARHLRIRRVGAPRRPGRDRPRSDRPRPHPCRRSPPTRARPRRGLGRTRRRRTTRTARRRRALRPGGRARPDRDARARPGRHPRRGGHPPQRHPLDLPTPTSCSARSSSAASPPTPGPTARSSFGWLPGCASGRRRRRAPWPKPTRRWPTWPPTGSPAPPCSFPDRPSSARTALASAGSPRSATRASPATAPVNRGVQGPDPKGPSAAAAAAAQRAALSQRCHWIRGGPHERRGSAQDRRRGHRRK